MEEIKEWFESGMKDFKAAENSLQTKDYGWACFQAQQAVEKGLKALYVKKYEELLKAHDLVLLARKVDAPEKIVILCSKINPCYVDTRYPDLSKD